MVQYSINKSKIFLGFVGPQWEQHIVAELDSSLNKWIDEVPDHCERRSHHSHLIISLLDITIQYVGTPRETRSRFSSCNRVRCMQTTTTFKYLSTGRLYPLPANRPLPLFLLSPSAPTLPARVVMSSIFTDNVRIAVYLFYSYDVVPCP